MERPGAAGGQQTANDAAAPERFAVIVGEPTRGPACRIEAPARLQRQLQASRRELEDTVSPPLAGELRRIAPHRDETPSEAGLRIECAALTSWTSANVLRQPTSLVLVDQSALRRRILAAERSAIPVMVISPAAQTR